VDEHPVFRVPEPLEALFNDEAALIPTVLGEDMIDKIWFPRSQIVFQHGPLGLDKAWPELARGEKGSFS
jgi:hypothetical protein